MKTTLLLLCSTAYAFHLPTSTPPIVNLRSRSCVLTLQDAAAAAAPWWTRAALTSLLCCTLSLSPSACLAEEAAVVSPNGGSPVASEVIGLLDKYYLDRTFNGVDLPTVRKQLDEGPALTDEQALEKATGVVKMLGDRYSRVLTPAQTGKLGKYDVTGVGINLIVADDGQVKVGAVPPDSSDAAQLGISFGDVVLAINGKPAEGMTSFDALEAIQGDGASVTLRIKPAGDKAEARDVVLRKSFETRNPVAYKLVTDDDGLATGYIKLSEFNAQCKRRVREAVVKLRSDGARRLVLDLRGNGGGVLDGALGIAGLFLERPLVLYVTDANGSMQPLYSREAILSDTLPLEVWVDQGTASSGEVLAAALRDNCRAKLVGGTTFGKGVIQGVFGLSDGGALIETVASYSTPSRDEINRIGVKPDEQKTFISDVSAPDLSTPTSRMRKYPNRSRRRPARRSSRWSPHRRRAPRYLGRCRRVCWSKTFTLFCSRRRQHIT